METPRSFQRLAVLALLELRLDSSNESWKRSFALGQSFTPSVATNETTEMVELDE